MSAPDTRIADFGTISWTAGTGARDKRRAVHLVKDGAGRTFCGQAIPPAAAHSMQPLAHLTCSRCLRRRWALEALALFAQRELIGRPQG